MSHLPADGRMAHEQGVSNIKGFHQSREIVRIGIHFVAVPWLIGPAVAPAVVRDNAVSLLPEKQHLRVPRIGGERPPVREHDRASRAPNLVVNLR
jgi:hypothetical protein